MNSKERVRTTLDHKQPDRMPVNVTFVPEIAKKLREKFNISGDVGAYMGNDAVTAPGGFETSYYQEAEQYVCRYGVKWMNVYNQFGAYTEMVEHPLAGSKSKLAGWNVPDYNEPSQYDALREQVKRYGKEKWVVGTITCTIFETAWGLRGLEQLMIDMMEDEEYTSELFDKVMEFPLHAGLKYIDLGVDMVWIGDDVAMQTGMLISPALFRKYLKPRFARIVSEYKKRNKDIKVMYHSCGNPTKVIDDLIEVGIDVLHSLQPSAIDLAATKKQFGDRISFWGGVDIQKLMPMGTPEQIKAEVKRLIDTCGRDGGYVLAPAHHIQADTPLENIFALYEAVEEYGRF
jgi:uroporphyrinogen decarboxylase